MERTGPYQVPPLSITVRMIVRDWLNANSVVLLQPDYNVVADTGCSSHADQTLAFVRRPEHLGDESLQLVVNTHCHSNHMGGNALLARTYSCPVAIPEREAQLIRDWDTRALWLDYADQYAERFAVNHVLVAGSRYTWGELSWEAIAAPGHDMGALVFYCAAERLLISGDAWWEDGFGVVLPDRPSALKVMLMFTLLERRQLAHDTLPGYLDSIPVYREYNHAYFGLAPWALAEMLVSELERGGAVARTGEFLKPGAGYS